MITPKPNTKEMDRALLEHSAGGRAIVKPALYLHATREAIARTNGFRSWAEYRKHLDTQSHRFMIDILGCK